MTDYTLSGQWQVVLSVYDVTEAEYDLELRENGQIDGCVDLAAEHLPRQVFASLTTLEHDSAYRSRWGGRRHYDVGIDFHFHKSYIGLDDRLSL